MTSKTKKLLSGLTLGLVLVSATAFAAPMEGKQAQEKYSGKHREQRIQMHKQAMTQRPERHAQVMAWTKQDFAQAVQDGRMTQQEADARITIMEERFAAQASGGKFHNGLHRPDYSQMTEQEKADFAERNQVKLQWYQQDLAQEVAAGNITQAQADEQVASMRQHFQFMQNKNKTHIKGKIHHKKGSKSFFKVKKMTYKNYANLNAEQQAEFRNREKVKIQWQQQDIERALKAGKMTQREADARMVLLKIRMDNLAQGKVHNPMANRKKYADMTPQQQERYRNQKQIRLNWAKEDVQDAEKSGILTKKEAAERMKKIDEQMLKLKQGKEFGKQKQQGQRLQKNR